MKVKVYVNWEENEVCSEKEAEQVIADYCVSLMTDAFDSDSDDLLYRALREEGITPEDYAWIFSLTEEDKAFIRVKVEQACEEAAHEWFKDYYCEYEFEV